jgi:hypothetical protein
LAATAPAAAEDPVLVNETTVWSSWLTPVTSTIGTIVNTGCSDEGVGRFVGHGSCNQPGVEGAQGSIWLSKSTFQLSGQTYRFTQIVNNGGVLTIKLDNQIPSDLWQQMAFEILPYVEPIDVLTSPHLGFAPSFTEPDANRLDNNAFTTLDDASSGTQTHVTTSAPTDWKMATSASVKYENGRTEHYGSKSVWGGVALRLVYSGTPPQAQQPPSGSGGSSQGLGKLAPPTKIEEPQPVERQPQGQVQASGNGVPDPAQPSNDGSAEPAAPAPPQRPALDGAAADYDADGDGRISSDEYGAAAAEYGKTNLSVAEILQIRRAYIESQQ